MEAEPEDAEMNGSPSRTRARTRTTKIPLQADSPPVEQMKHTARERKSQTSSRKSGTPERKGRASSRIRRQSVTDLDIIPLGDDAEEDDWLKTKRSPKKRKSTRKSTAAVDVEVPKSSSPSKTRSKLAGTAFQIRTDTDAEAEFESVEPGPAMTSDSPELQKLDLNQISIRPRALSTKSKNNEDVCTQNSIDVQQRLPHLHTQLQARKVSANSAMSYPTPSPTSSYHGDSDDIRALDVESVENEGAEVLDTILESEGFTMIDLDTLPSARRDLSGLVEEESAPAADLAQTNLSAMRAHSKQSTRTTTKSIASSLSPVSEQTVAYPILKVDESEISSTVPSSPPAAEKNLNLLKASLSSRPNLVRKITPLPYSSPKLPSPPRHEVRRTPHHRHRGSASALFAGIALQEIVSPDSGAAKALPQENTLTSKLSSNQEGLFTGFDSGTQRELRAGLRFGEELGKRQVAERQSPLPGSSSGQTRDAGSTDALKAAMVQPQRLDVASVTAYSINQNSNDIMEDTPQTPLNKMSALKERALLDTQAKREAEWQLEREAISRQIQNASESQVIVIDSDSENEDEDPFDVQPEVSLEQADDGLGDETDIWLAEAKSSSSPPHAPNQTLFTRTEQEKQRQRAQEVISRPRRSLIPSPWKRGEDVDTSNEQNSYMSTGLDEMTGLNFYEGPGINHHVSAGQTKKQHLQQRRKSGKFDIDLMAGTPKKEVVEEVVDMTDADQPDESMGDEQSLDNSATPNSDEEGSISLTQEAQDMNGESANESSELSEVPSSVGEPGKIPVKLNDSSMSVSTPPARAQISQLELQDHGEASADSPPRPPTPRSAMKGSRVIFNQIGDFVRPNTPTMIRKVIFSGRSRGVDVDGQENSFSMRSSSDDTSFGDEVGQQLRQELHAAEAPSNQPHPLRRAVEKREEQIEPTCSGAVLLAQEVPTTTSHKGWSNWFGGPNLQSNSASQTDGQDDIDLARPSSESIMASNTAAQQHSQRPQESQWQRTKSTVPTSTRASLSTKKGESTLPSYLLAPSYPSDPLRSTKTPLSLSGEFTNTHFRTLHIIYRKSLRPKFHPPVRSQIRNEIWALRGKEHIVDESDGGLVKCEFVWTVGDGEVEVLERFMQECEFSHGWFKGVEVREGAKAVSWGWTVEELCERLCRIVVGEAVREEERKVRDRERAVKQ